MLKQTAFIMYKAECMVKYRYTCERCEHTTDWFESTLCKTVQHEPLHESSTVEAERNMHALEQTKNKALESLQNLVLFLQKILRRLPREIIAYGEPLIAEQFNELFAAGKACPKCRCRQTWYPALAYHTTKWKSMLYYSIATVLLGNGLIFAIIMSIFDNHAIPLIFFAILQLPYILIGSGLGYYIVYAREREKKQFYNSAPWHGAPEVQWGESVVELMGMPEAGEDVNAAKPIEMSFNDRVLAGVTSTRKENLGYRHMLGIRHPNLLCVHELTELDQGVFTVKEEKYQGVPLSVLIEEGLEEGDFQDYILQLCDALNALHQHKPSILHNKVSAQNILIGRDNLLKLTHFDEAAIGDLFTNDIAMVGKLMGSVEAKYIRRYKNIIRKSAGVYTTIDSLRADVLRRTKRRLPFTEILKIIILAVIIFTLTTIAYQWVFFSL